MNKAQQEYFSSKFRADHYGIIYITKSELEKRIVEYSNIDPAPDPETYCIWMDSKSNDINESISGGFTEEQATTQLRVHMNDTLSMDILEYKKGIFLIRTNGTRYEVRKE